MNRTALLQFYAIAIGVLLVATALQHLGYTGAEIVHRYVELICLLKRNW